MHMYRFSGVRSTLLTAAIAAMVPASASGQLRQVVSNQLAISEQEASLHLEFADQGTLDVEFRNGQVFVDAAVVGTYDRRGALDVAWRQLLGEVVTFENGALARALQAWDPPSSLGGQGAAIAQQLDGVIEGALLPPAVDANRAEVVEVSLSSELDLVELLSRASVLPALAGALEDVQEDGLQIYVEQDVLVDSGTRLDRSLLLVDGNLTLQGEIDGDVVVTQGSVRLEEGALITGDLRLVDARLYRDGGTIEGRVVSIESEGDRLARTLRDEIRTELRDELRSTARRARDDHSGLSRWFGGVAQGVGDIFEDLVQLFLLAAGSLLVVFLWKDRLNVIADAARRTPIKAAIVGTAGAFLVLPVWILGSVALIVSIVGILALPFWLLLFPVVAAVAVGVGYLGVARNIGEWLANQNFTRIDHLRTTNTFYAVLAGITGLAVFSLLANFLGMLGPVLGMLENVVAWTGSVITMTALLIGFGSVLLTRGGKRPDSYEAHDPFDDDIWAPKTTVEVEVEEIIETAETDDEAVAETEAPSAKAEPEAPRATPTDDVGADDHDTNPEPVAETEKEETTDV